MCLAVPARLSSREGDQGTADLHGTLIPVCLLFAPEAVVGDWVLVHAGFVIGRLEPEQAERTWSVLADLSASLSEGTP